MDSKLKNFGLFITEIKFYISSDNKYKTAFFFSFKAFASIQN